MLQILIFILFLFSSADLWAQEGLGSLISPGDLSAAHQKYDGITNCTKCHEMGRGVPDSKCLDCHDKLAERIKKRQGLHAKYTAPCISCHDEHKGRNFKIISLAKEKFNHDDTGYALKDKHSDVKCDKCHKKEGVYAGLSRDCITCHPDKHKGQLDRDCGRCHDVTGWKNVERFRHDSESKYPLTGKHIDIKCAKCHPDNRFKIEKYEECITCHKDPHKGKPACKECHTTEGWKKVKIDHSRTKYPLTNKHQEVACDKCHKDNRLKEIPFSTCDGSFCHKDPHKNQFKDRTCESCHTTKGWKPSLFEHASPEYKGFKLDGKHVDTKCEKCHIQGRYKPLSYKTCDTSDCHKDEHKGQFKGRGCETCHTTKEWKPSLFEHASLEYKGFKLDGKHVDTKCEKCHVQGHYKPLNYKTCDTSDCHKDEHKGQFKGRGCETCHTTKGWKPSLFEHASLEYKGFKLEGKHVDTKCEKCHAAGKYRPVATNCFGCHEKDDTHKGEVGNNCEKCHNADSWKKSTLDHNKQTKFPLVGRHIDVKCDKCHAGKKYRVNKLRCADCHEDIHKGSFKEECGACHTQSDWQPRKFNHKKLAGFDLKGVHNDISCINCHKVKGVYKGANRYCNQCHVDPHLNQFGSVGCPQCHSESSWNPTFFNHSKTGYPLVGRHRSAECQDCHRDRVYRGTTAACVGCHLSQYSAAPNHLANGYSRDCTRCHTSSPTSWVFNHSKAAGSAGCANCHLSKTPASHSTNNFGTSCENCHKYPTWTFIHPTTATGCGNSGCHLTYSTPPRPVSHTTNNWTECQNCHKYPTWTFSHPAGGTGCGNSGCHLTYSTPARPADHATNNWTTCENCHRYPSWKFNHTVLTSGCNTCHSAKYPSAHQTYNNRFGTTCESCHKYPSWSTGTFNHSFTSFPTSHKGYSGCPSCHPGQNYSNKGGCIECHNSVGAEVHETNQNSGCLSCHPTGKGDKPSIRRGK